MHAWFYFMSIKFLELLSFMSFKFFLEIQHHQDILTIMDPYSTHIELFKNRTFGKPNIFWRFQVKLIFTVNVQISSMRKNFSSYCTYQSVTVCNKISYIIFSIWFYSKMFGYSSTWSFWMNPAKKMLCFSENWCLLLKNSNISFHWKVYLFCWIYQVDD
jgi:hypothetical protein